MEKTSLDGFEFGKGGQGLFIKNKHPPPCFLSTLFSQICSPKPSESRASMLIPSDLCRAPQWKIEPEYKKFPKATGRNMNYLNPSRNLYLPFMKVGTLSQWMLGQHFGLEILPCMFLEALTALLSVKQGWWPLSLPVPT